MINEGQYEDNQKNRDPRVLGSIACIEIQCEEPFHDHSFQLEESPRSHVQSFLRRVWSRSI